MTHALLFPCLHKQHYYTFLTLITVLATIFPTHTHTDGFYSLSDDIIFNEWTRT